LAIAGLGMGFTLRAALDVVSPTADVTICEINFTVVDWCRGPLAAATRNAIKDGRVTVKLEDVSDVIAKSPAARYDAILLDLYEGPNAASQRSDDPFYGAAALARAHKALRPSGILAVWSEDADAAFEKRFTAAGFAVTTHSIGQGGRRHVVYLGRRP
jgi:spermidine synthase